MITAEITEADEQQQSATVDYGLRVIVSANILRTIMKPVDLNYTIHYVKYVGSILY